MNGWASPPTCKSPWASRFARYDAISPYGEDLRTVPTLPLADWAIAFKPQMWAFFVLPPAAAFSIMYAVFLGTCLVGWYLLALQLRFGRSAAAIFALSIFALPYVQLWWTPTGPLVAFLPWLLLACLVPMPAYWRIPLVAWASACFVLSHIYVPFIAALVFAAALVIAGLRPDVLHARRVVAVVIGGAIGCAIAVFYLWDPIQVMTATVYPGHRTHVSGAGVPRSFVFAHLFPHFGSAHWAAFYANSLEVGTGGSYALLSAFVFLDFRRVREVTAQNSDTDRLTRLSILALGGGMLMILAWWLLPIPSAIARPLLWNAIAPQRLAFAAGLLGHALAFVLLLRVGAVASLARVAIAVVLIVAVALASKTYFFHAELGVLKYDLVILPLLLIAYGGLHRRLIEMGTRPAALRRLVECNRVRPVQSAAEGRADLREIRCSAVSRVRRETGRTSERLAGGWRDAARPPGRLRIPADFSNILYAPQLEFFRAHFPDIPAEQFNEIFNRSAHIQVLEGIKAPNLLQTDVIQVPPSAFEK